MLLAVDDFNIADFLVGDSIPYISIQVIHSMSSWNQIAHVKPHTTINRLTAEI